MKELKYVYRPYIKTTTYDCWGRYEVDYIPSNDAYENYEVALKISTNGEVEKIRVL